MHPTPRFLLAFAALVRVLVPLTAYVVTSDSQVFHASDTSSYLEPTQEFLSNGTFSVNGRAELERTPGYSLVLALGVAIHQVELATIALQIILSLLCVWLVFQISLQLLDSRRRATAAAWLYAIEPLSILYASMLLTETWYVTLLLVSIHFLIRHVQLQNKENRVVTAPLLLSAGALAASTYVRPISYFLPLFVLLGWAAAILIGYLRGRIPAPRRLLASPVVFTLVSMTLIGVWQIRNRVQADYSGFSAVQDVNLYFYLGAATLASVEGKSYYDVQGSLGYHEPDIYFARHPEQKRWSEGDIFRFQRREGKRMILAAPLNYAKIHVKGIVLTLFEPGAIDFLKLFGLDKEGGGLLGALHDRGIVAVALEVVQKNALFFWSNLVLAVYLFGILGLSLWAFSVERFA